MYSGASGLRSHSVGMSSIANNIANVNTLAFKNAMLLYSDHTSAGVYSAGGNGITEMSQCGLGVSVQVNRTMFQEGALAAGDSVTDMAIAGKGFFGLEKDGVIQYGRAGNFRFTSAGDLQDPNGFGLLGYQVTNGAVSGNLTPVKLDFSENGQGYMPPKATSAVTLIENLGSTARVNSSADNPYFSVAASWNGAVTPPVAGDAYGHSSKVQIYDASGQVRDVTAYYDYVGSFDGKKVYQYAIGADPASDGSANAGTSVAGLLAMGTITFSSEGHIEDMTMFVPPEGGGTDLTAWVPAPFDASGNPVFTANFLDADGAPLGVQSIGLNMGLNMSGTWRNDYTGAGDLTNSPNGVTNGTPRERAAASSTSHAGASGTMSSVQDGYGAGYLQDLKVTAEGYIVGNYSNGESDSLFRVPVYRFINEEGLRHEGGNRYTATLESGEAEEGFPTEENYGSLLESTLEQSNVDLAREFVSMIQTQRGFQMNSKVVTTSDAMLQKALELKR